MGRRRQKKRPEKDEPRREKGGRLLEKLLIEGLPVGEAVAQTAAEVGPDPLYGAELRLAFRR